MSSIKENQGSDITAGIEMEAHHANGFWVIPTLNRPANLKRFFIAARNRYMSTPGLLLVDEVDYTLNCLEYQKLDLPPNWRFYVTPGAVTQGEKFRFIEKTALYRKSMWIGTLNDDHVPATDYWDIKILEQINGKNVVSANDEWMALRGRICSPVVWSIPLLDVVGGVFPGDFQHSYIDDLWERIGKDTGCWTIDMDVICHHIHHLSGQAPHDSTYGKADSFRGHDQKEWEKWLGHSYLPNLKKVREFLR